MLPPLVLLTCFCAPEVGRQTTTSIDDFASYVRANAVIKRDANGARDHIEIDSIDKAGIQYRYFEENRFPGERAQIKMKVKWSWVKSVQTAGTSALLVHLDREPVKWSKNNSDKWHAFKANDQTAFFVFPDKRRAIVAKKKIATMLECLGLKPAVE